MSSGFKVLIALFLAAYVLVLGLIMAHYRFPYTDAADYIRKQAETAGWVKVDFSAIEKGIPFNIRLRGLDVGLAEFNETIWLLQSDQVRIKIKPSRFLTGRIYGVWKAEAWGGEAGGRFEYKAFGVPEYYFALDTMDFPKFSLARTAGLASVAGPLTGQMIVYGRDQIFPSDGKGKIIMGPGRFGGRPLPELPKQELDFKRLELVFDIKNNELSLESLSVDGPQIELRLSGKLVNFLRPELNLTGSIRFGPNPRTASKLNFKLTGPLANPRLGLGSQP